MNEPDGSRPEPPDEATVAALFDGIVSRYDLLNGVLSLGLDRVWRRAAARATAVRPGHRILDLGCGTGDLAAGLARGGARVTGVDASAGMLAAARSRRLPGVDLVRGSAFRLPFAGGAFDAAASAFVLRNLDDLPAAFRELARVTRPGGRLVLLDITEPGRPLVRRLFDAFFGLAAPFLGTLAGRRDAYTYLVRSVGHLPPATDLCADLRRAEFDRVRARPLTGGIVTLFTANRPSGGRTGG